MKHNIVQTLIIFPIIVLGYLITTSLSSGNIQDFFSYFLERFIFLLIYTIIPVSLAILFWLYLSEQIIRTYKVVRDRKYLVYLILNFVIPISIMFIQNFVEFGYRWNFGLLSDFFKGEYFTDYGFIVIGLLPTFIKIAIDLMTKNRYAMT